MEVFPAIDLRGGKCVRLYQGDYDQQTTYGDDPVAQARSFAHDGATWIHVVDLDAARTGVAHDLTTIASIVAGVDAQVQCGGGVRDRAKADALLSTGVSRVVVGTAAIEDPGLVSELTAAYPGQVAVGLDARRRVDDAGAVMWDVATRGWEQDSGRDMVDVAQEFEDRGVAALIVTEIGRDGTMEGPDTQGLARVLASTSMDVIASGGVGSLADLRALSDLESQWRKLHGVIIGRALYEGAFTLSEAIAVLA